MRAGEPRTTEAPALRKFLHDVSSRPVPQPAVAMRAGILLLGLLGLCIIPSARADDSGVPSRIGRIDLVSGGVSFRLTNDKTWSVADFNYPVYTGMTLSTEDKARAEITIGANALQMSSETVLDITTLNNRLSDIVLHQGRVHLSLHVLRPGEGVEFEFAKGTVWLLQAGYYEIDLAAGDAPSRISVIDGKARFVATDADVDIASDQVAVLQDDEKVSLVPKKAETSIPDQPLAPAGATQTSRRNTDDFTAWATDRDALPISGVPKNLERDTTGYAELDAYGEWQISDTYGRIWLPTDVPDDWEPYRFGHWISVPPWGPTWVDDQPWGFVPFHYGRWVQVDGRWGWLPGDPNEPAVYAPALVAFVGSPDDNGIMDDSGDPAVAWVPLGPDEPFDPWYAADPAYIERINAGSVRDFHHWSPERLEEWRRDRRLDGFANRRFATAIGRDAFLGARPVAAAMVHIDPERFDRAPVMGGAPHLGDRRFAVDPVVHAGPPVHPATGEHPGAPHSEVATREPGGSHPAEAPHPSEAPHAPGVPRTSVPPHASEALRAPGLAHTPVVPHAPFAPMMSRGNAFQAPPASRFMAAPHIAPHVAAPSGGRKR